MKNEIPTAFPWTHGDLTCTGMGLRDYIAIKSLKTYSDDTPELMLQNAIRAYKQADAMLRAREAT